MKKTVHIIIEWCNELLCIFFFILPTLLEVGGIRFPYRKKKKGVLAVLANGPSLKDVLTYIATNNKEFIDVEFSCMNFFASSSYFEMIKPKYYCLVDPMFCQDTFRRDDVKATFEALQNKVDWNLTLFIPSYYRMERFLSYSQINNKKIKIVELKSIPYTGNKTLVYKFLFKHGLTIPRSTVAQTCIFTAINMGYDTIRLYGAEHTFFSSLAVNAQGQLCSVEEHFYGKSEGLQPIIRNDNGMQYKVSDFLFQKAWLFKMHDILNDYSKSVGCEIFNHTPITMIDSYKRVL